MSREIKFRVWDKEKEEWWTDILSEMGEHDNYDDELSMWSVGRMMEEGDNSRLKFCQYIGLKDKNGKEIYEGNITELDLGAEGKRRFLVKITTVFREVVSHPDFRDVTSRVAITGVVFEWCGYQLFPNVDGKGLCDNENMVVIGNIYENPELIGAPS